jgi:hypothetical protein
MSASQKGHLEVVQALLGHDAEPNTAGTRDGSTALMFASQKGHLEVVQALLDHKADPNTARTSDGSTALMFASQCGHLEVVQALLEYKTDIDQIQNDGATALMGASSSGHLEMVQHLVANGANVTAKIGDGRDVRSSAALNGHHNVASWLDTIEGWPSFRVAVSFMTSPAEIKAVLWRGRVDPDECSGSLAAVRATAEQSGSREMKKLVKHALSGWSRHTHVLYTAPVQEAVVATLLAANRHKNGTPVTDKDAAGEDAVDKDAAAAAGGPSLASLPPEMWEEILHFLARSQWFTRLNAIVLCTERP